MTNQNITKIDLQTGKKVYFASDFHLGTPSTEASFEREKKLIRWLDTIKHDAQIIFLVGDVYDFWFEYKYTIPKGFIRFQGKLAELADQGIKFYFFPGNHDLWMFDYYQKELGATVSRNAMQFEIGSTKCFVAHGDGRGPGDTLHKLILKVFESKFFQWVFTIFPSDFSYWIANTWSKGSRATNNIKDEQFLGENEWLWSYAKELERSQHHDFYIFGHRHLVLDLKVGKNSRYINLGDWLGYYTYAIFDGSEFTFTKFEG
ncbi:MAG: UDP-2,3-diacylglucosamine diphosphatase [Cytophagales bacterium]